MAVCKYYVKRECVHGRAGKECKFRHPKICPRYAKNGDRNGGCKKGPNCHDFHPKLCSLEKRECSRIRCQYFHVTGTKSTYEEWNVNGNSQNTADIATNFRRESTYAGKMGTRVYPQYQDASRPQNRILQNQNTTYSNVNPNHHNSVDPNVPENRQDFLMMNERLLRLETMLTSVLQSVRPPGLGAGVPGQH